MIPNSYATIGTHSPACLKAILSLDEIVGTSSLTQNEIEAIRLAVSVHAGCAYGIAAHSFLARFSGLCQSTIKRIKASEDCGHQKLDILLSFVRHLVGSKGVLDIAHLESLRSVGYTEQNIIEITLAIASTSFINMVNKVNDTAVDFPAEE